jgi:hypothetical protein
MMPFVRYACWGPGEAEHFVRKEALEGDPATFLSVHMPFRTLDVPGGTLPEGTEQAVLEALVPRSHAVALFEGEPGSGKSHLIRWLKTRWKTKDGDHLVLVPRSDGSLQGTLERLRRELGSPYSAPLEGLGRIDQLGEQGRAEAFLGQLITFSRSSSYAPGERLPEHADWLDLHEVWRFLAHSAVRENWRAPLDIVKLLTGAEGKRDQEAARFTPTHIAALVRAIRTRETGARVRDFGLKAQRLYVDLSREADLVDKVVHDVGGDVNAQRQALAERAPNTVRLMQALDARCAHAIQGFIGVQRNELQNRFLDVRRTLRRDGRRLVLFLEDITNLQGVDLQLIEALLPNVAAEENADLCELVAVLGVTPGYFQQAIAGLSNILDRLHLHVRLTSPEVNVVNTEAALLRNEQSRLQFLATYLNAVRLGRERVQRWYNVDGPDEDRPNVCTGCPYRGPCHATFGSVEVPGIEQGPVGLYPLSPASAQRFWAHLRDPQAARTLHTPRGLLFNVVSEVLAGREALQNGAFPPPEIEGTNLEAPSPGAELHDVLARVPDPGERARLQRTVLWWREGEEMDGARRTSVDGTVFYSGVRQGVMGAFAVQWPGEGVVEPLGTDSRQPQNESQRREKPVAAEPSSNARAEEKRPPTGAAPPPVPPMLPELPPEWTVRLNALNRWRDGGNLEHAADWEALAFDALADAGAEFGRVPNFWSVVFTKDNIVLAGAHARRTALQFELPRDSAVHRGLTALAWLRHGKNLDRGTRQRRLADVAVFQSWLAERACAHYDAKLEDVQKTLGGEPLELAISSLMAGAWLAGIANPREDLPSQWIAALTSEQSPGTQLTKEWNDLVKTWTDRRLGLRDIVGAWARVGQEPRSGHGLVDAARIYRLVSDARTRLETGWPEGRGEFPRKLESLLLLRELADKLRLGLAPAVILEDSRVRELCGTLRGLEQDADAFLPAVEQEIDDLRDVAPDLVPNVPYHRWREALKRLADAGLRAADRARVRAVDDAAFELARSPEDVPMIERLARVRSVNAGDLALIVEAANSAVQTVAAAYGKARSLVDAAGQQNDLAALETAAARIVSAGDALLKSAEAPNE